MRPMSLNSISNLMLLLSFFESSQSNLCSDPRDRSTGIAVYDAGIASEDYGGCSHVEAARWMREHPRSLKQIKFTHESHWPAESYESLLRFL